MYKTEYRYNSREKTWKSDAIRSPSNEARRAAQLTTHCLKEVGLT